MQYGYHLTPTRDNFLKAAEAGFRAAQFFLGSPQRFDNNYRSISLTLMGELIPEINERVIHTHYWYNLVKANGLCKKTVLDLCEVIEWAAKLRVRRIVSHLGYRRSKKDEEEGKEEVTHSYALEVLERICQFLHPKLEKAGVVLCLENCPGSKNGYMMGSLLDLVSLVESLSLPTIRICLDTQHAWANGEPIFAEGDEAFLRRALSLASVLHLNANPGTPFGGHKDSHSVTPLFEGEGYGERFFRRVLLAAQKDAVCIFERSYFPLMDLQYALRLGGNDGL